MTLPVTGSTRPSRSKSIDDDEVAVTGQIRRRLGQAEVVCLRRRAAQTGAAGLDADPARHQQAGANALAVGLAVVEIAKEALLPQIEVQRADPMADTGQRHEYLHRGGGFARASLLVAENDDMRSITHRSVRSRSWP
jgi:hypothetical protein